jgi:hypothetical protein
MPAMSARNLARARDERLRTSRRTLWQDRVERLSMEVAEHTEWKIHHAAYVTVFDVRVENDFRRKCDVQDLVADCRDNTSRRLIIRASFGNDPVNPIFRRQSL